MFPQVERVQGIRDFILKNETLLSVIFRLGQKKTNFFQIVSWEEVSGQSPACYLTEGVSARIFGVVYQGRALVAKTFEPVHITYEKEEMRREATLLSMIQHPNIIQCFGGDIQPNRSFLLLEYIPYSLADFIYRKTEAFDKKHLQILRGLSAALLVLHNAKIIHRDLKSNNVMISDEICPKLIDFGSCIYQEQSNIRTVLVGTTPYIAPEIFDKKIYTPAGDIYAFAMIIYELITRQLPWSHIKTNLQIPEMVLEGQRPTFLMPLSPQDRVPPTDAPHSFWYDLMEQCWSQDYTTRPSIQDVHDSISDQLNSENISFFVQK